MKSIWCKSQNKIKEIDLKYIDNLKTINHNNYSIFSEPNKMDELKILNTDINFKSNFKQIKNFLEPKDSKYETIRLIKLKNKQNKKELK